MCAYLQKEQKAAFLKKPIQDPIYTTQQNEIRWSYFKNDDPEVMYKFFTKFMKGATFMIPTPRLLAQVVDMLRGINMEDRDTKGDVYMNTCLVRSPQQVRMGSSEHHGTLLR